MSKRISIKGNLIGGNVDGSLNITGETNILDSTQSTDSSSGALIVSGGAGIGGNLFVGGTLNTDSISITGSLNIPDTTAADGATSGALTVLGGIGIAKNLDVGTTLEVSGTSELTGAVSMGSTMNVSGASTIGSTLNVTGNTTVGSTLSVTGITSLGSTLSVTGASTMSSTLKILDGTDSSSSTSNGAFIVVGGAVIGKNLVIGGDLIVEGTSTTINSTTTAIIDPMFKVADGNPADTSDFGFYGEYVSGGDKMYSGFHRVGADSTPSAPEIAGKWLLFDSATTEPGPLNVGDAGVAGDLVVGGLFTTTITNTGDLVISSATSSTNTSTGALTVAGGVGIGENLNVGGTSTFNNDITITGNIQQNSTSGSILFSVPTSITSYEINWPNAQGSNTQTLINDGNGNLTWGTPASGFVTTGGNLTLTDTTQTTATGTGSLIVSGGVSIDKALRIGGKFAVPIRTVISSDSLDDDYILNVDSTSSATITLPDITDDQYNGVTYVVIKQTANTVDLTTQAADKIFDGGTDTDTVSLTGASGQRIQIVSNGYKWFVM